MTRIPAYCEIKACAGRGNEGDPCAAFLAEVAQGVGGVGANQPIAASPDGAYSEPAAARCSKVIPRDNFVASSCHQAGEDPDVDARSQEVNRPVRKHRVGSAGVKAVDFAIVGAVDGTGSQG